MRFNKKHLFWVATFFMLNSCGGYYFKRGKTVEEDDTSSTPTGARVPGTVSFATDILPMLNSYCGDCHANKAPDYATALTLITEGKPESSTLYLKGTGNNHEKFWETNSDEAKLLADWISSPSE